MVLTISCTMPGRKVGGVSSRQAPTMEGVEDTDQKDPTRTPLKPVEAQGRRTTLCIASSDNLRIKNLQKPNSIFVDLQCAAA